MLMKIFTSDTMRSIDHKTISGGYVEGRILMERAGVGAAEEVLKFSRFLDPKFSQRFIVVCGKGNNGGDGYVMAKYFHEKGHNTKILSVCEIDDLSGDALFHARKLPKAVRFELIKDDITFESGDFIIDCLLGTGLNSEVRKPYSSIIESINSSGCPVAALDLASGLNGNDGKVLGVAVKADITLTIGFPKKGIFQNQGPEYSGRLKCIDIGFPQKLVDEFESAGELICEHELRNFFPRRGHDTHKYKCGNILIIGGSKNYSGAPMLAAGAAARSGAGMVTVAFPDSVVPSGPAGLIKVPLQSSKSGTFSRKSALEVRNLFDKKDVVVVGPGMTGDEEELYLMETIFNSKKTVVADAGALLHLAKKPELLNREAVTVITPHAGELKRLLEKIGDRDTKELALRGKCFVVVKGQYTEVISPNGETVKNSTGCSALAVAGSGDVLSGMIGAFLGWSEKRALETVSAAVAVHGLCGEVSQFGTYGNTADDLIDHIPVVMKGLSPFC